MVATLAILGGLALIPVVIVIRAAILVSIWAWFMVPLGAPDIGVAMAIGITCVVSMIVPHPDKKGDGWQGVIGSVIGWLVVWLIAWIAQMFL